MSEFASDPESLRIRRDWEAETQADGTPAVSLDFATTWCPRHLEPFRAEWPRGAGVAMIRLFQAFAENEDAQAMAGGDTMQLGAVTAECSPLCCFVGEDALSAIYAEAGVNPPAA